MNYVLVTPLKNEEKYIPKLKEIVFNQTLKPVCWVIVDSGSRDGTFKLSKQIAQENEWVHVVKQEKFFEKGYGHLNFSEAVNEGYKKVKSLCERDGINYGYIGKTDATPILCKDYFKVLLAEMIKDKRVVITCGIQKLIYKNGELDLKPMKRFSLTGFNDIRLYKKDFFEKIGGYPLMPSPDSALLIKACNKNLKVKVVNDVYFMKPRKGGVKVGFWKGYTLKGKYMYVLAYHPILALFNALANSVKMPPYYQFLPMLWGYFLSALKRDDQISDKEIKEYYGKKRLREIINSITGGKFV